jgi:hypothetical protein
VRGVRVRAQGMRYPAAALKAGLVGAEDIAAREAEEADIMDHLDDLDGGDDMDD